MIGSGCFGKVLAVHRQEGQKILKLALKVVDAPDQESLVDAINELKNVAALSQHPNIIRHEQFWVNSRLGLDKKTIFHQVLIEMPLQSNSLENILNMYGGLTELELVDI